MTPIYFGSAERPLFGWMHAAPAGAAAPLAVLLCAPLGHEDLSTHRGQRALACALSAAGLAVLRFDHAGWGDSADAADAGDPAAQWLASLHVAADTLRQRSGAPRLALLGVRMGALLAALAASGRSDVDALVALLPVTSGRAWLRECRLLAGDAAPAAADGGAEAVTEVGGLVFDAAAAQAVAALRWPAAGRAPAHALLIERDDALAADQAAASLRALGAEVQAERRADLGQLIATAHSSHTPAALIERIVGWLLARAGAVASSGLRAAAAPAAPAAVAMALRAGTVTISERPVRIGSGPALAGVLSQPARADRASAPRGLLLLSSGAERRIGPNRLWVRFARERAAAGDLVLRLDLAGIGDSDDRPGRDGCDIYDPRHVDDIATALGWLRAEGGARRCDVVGVCSGAYHAWRAALQGLPLSTVVAVNPLVFHWKPGMSLDPTAHAFGQITIAAAAGRSLRDPARWARLLRGQVDLPQIATAVAARAGHTASGWARGAARSVGWPLADDLAGELHRVAQRGARLCFVFSEGDPGQRLLAEQAGRALARLRRNEQVRLRTIASADHTFTRLQARGALYGALHPLLDDAVGAVA